MRARRATIAVFLILSVNAAILFAARAVQSRRTDGDLPSSENTFLSAYLRVPGVPQDCGVRSLFLAGRLLQKKPDSLNAVRNVTGGIPTRRSMQDLVTAAQRMGFAVSGVRTDRKALNDILNVDGAVAILHCDIGHFVVAYRAQDGRVSLIDPSEGAGRLDLATLCSNKYQWKGAALLVSCP
jgi:ABC-type bacteriocin/lantibiotic exporter with double-glycine peptidase domain